MSNIDKIETMMEQLGCTGDRITRDRIMMRIKEIEFKTIELCGTKMMYCGIKIGKFTVVGKPSVCISPENWRDEIGEQVSFDNTFQEIYRLEAYKDLAD